MLFRADAAPFSDASATTHAAATLQLAVNGYKVQGLQKADLTWSDASSTNVDVYRNNGLITTTANDGFHSDNINNRGGGSYTYRVYEPGASLVPQPGQTVTGADAIREALGGFLALKGKIEVETVYCIQTGDLALSRGRWRLNGTDADGSPVGLRGNTTEVLRRQPDGRWLYVIDHPYGSD